MSHAWFANWVLLLQDHFDAVLEHSNPSVAEGDLEEFVEFTVSTVCFHTIRNLETMHD